MTSPAPLTEAEKAAAEALALWHNAHSSTSRLATAAFEGEARTVVAAVKPLIAQELAESAEVIYRFAESRPITSAEARAIFDGIAAALSRPTSEEQQ